MTNYFLDLFEKCQIDTKLQDGTIDVYLYSDSGETLKTFKMHTFMLISLDAEYYNTFTSGNFSDEKFGFTLDSFETPDGFMAYVKDFILYITAEKKRIWIDDNHIQKYLTSKRFKHDVYGVHTKDILLWYNNLPKYTFEEFFNQQNRQSVIVSFLSCADVYKRVTAVELKIFKVSEMLIKTDYVTYYDSKKLEFSSERHWYYAYLNCNQTGKYIWAYPNKSVADNIYVYSKTCHILSDDEKKEIYETFFNFTNIIDKNFVTWGLARSLNLLYGYLKKCFPSENIPLINGCLAIQVGIPLVDIEDKICFDFSCSNQCIVRTYTVANVTSDSKDKKIIARKSYKFIKEKYDPFNFEECLGNFIEVEYTHVNEDNWLIKSDFENNKINVVEKNSL
ncbi:hypothetical protein Catovirus_1_140 [Catovirus CTV1]|uniref:Uncharacterized protein n=1 Tax=Catovirus CTV1 TaxID=1977631 RepID=A0A1V0S8Q5_9VIRU|nr:hypothetical protein Catovirus_1_140 [Catovirus CTV1]